MRSSTEASCDDTIGDGSAGKVVTIPVSDVDRA